MTILINRKILALALLIPLSINGGAQAQDALPNDRFVSTQTELASVMDTQYEWLNALVENTYTLQIATTFGLENCQSIKVQNTAEVAKCFESSTKPNRWFAVIGNYVDRASAAEAAQEYGLKGSMTTRVSRIMKTRCELPGLNGKYLKTCQNGVVAAAAQGVMKSDTQVDSSANAKSLEVHDDTTHDEDTVQEGHSSDKQDHAEAYHYVPELDGKSVLVEYSESVFKKGPQYPEYVYDAKAQLDIYGAKREVFTPRPLLELGRPQYQNGPLTNTISIIGDRNKLAPALAVYGDLRTGIAYNDNGGQDVSQFAARLNLDIDLKLTATERLHAFVRPIDDGQKFSRIEFNRGNGEEEDEFILDGNLETLFFEGDLGAITSGLTGKASSFDLPFAIGKMPLLMQNGVWLEDAFTGVAVTLPARNSRLFDISNYDVTFFAGFDDVSSLAIRDEQGLVAESDVNVYGIATFLDMLGGYAEVDYAFIDGQDQFDAFDHHSFSVAFSKRIHDFASTSFRIIHTFGQDLDKKDATADGTLLVWESSLITSKPLTLIPYMNLYAGFDRPQSVARDNGGILKTIGINFETDALTGFPRLDDSGQDVWGGAIGIENLFSLEQQIVVEVATVQLMDDQNPLGQALSNQYALGVRYQRPLSRTWLVRADTVKIWQDDGEDSFGARLELRRKF